MGRICKQVEEGPSSWLLLLVSLLASLAVVVGFEQHIVKSSHQLWRQRRQMGVLVDPLILGSLTFFKNFLILFLAVLGLPC